MPGVHSVYCSFLLYCIVVSCCVQVFLRFPVAAVSAAYCSRFNGSGQLRCGLTSHTHFVGWAVLRLVDCLVCVLIGLVCWFYSSVNLGSGSGASYRARMRLGSGASYLVQLLPRPRRCTALSGLLLCLLLPCVYCVYCCFLLDCIVVVVGLYYCVVIVGVYCCYFLLLPYVHCIYCCFLLDCIVFIVGLYCCIVVVVVGLYCCCCCWLV